MLIRPFCILVVLWNFLLLTMNDCKINRIRWISILNQDQVTTSVLATLYNLYVTQNFGTLELLSFIAEMKMPTASGMSRMEINMEWADWYGGLAGAVCKLINTNIYYIKRIDWVLYFSVLIILKTNSANNDSWEVECLYWCKHSREIGIKTIYNIKQSFREKLQNKNQNVASKMKISKLKHMQWVSCGTETRMVDLGGYVIILVETNDKRVKLYGLKNTFCCCCILYPLYQVLPLTRLTWRLRTRYWKLMARLCRIAPTQKWSLIFTM